MSIEWVDFNDCQVRLACGDCRELSQSLESESVDSVITDPPYGIDYQSARRIDKANWKPKIANDERPFVWFLPDSYRLAKPGGCLLCFCRWDVQEAFRSSIGWAGWSVKAQVIWDRESHGMGDLNGCPAPQHDVIWFATRDRFNFHGDRPKSVVRSLRLGGEQLVHPNQKPDDLMSQLVEAYSPEGGLVADFFMGSCSTGVACVRSGRRFIGFEQDRRHFDTSCERIAAEFDRLRLFEPAAKITQKEMFAEDAP